MYAIIRERISEVDRVRTRIHELITKKQAEESAQGNRRFLTASVIAQETGLSRNTIKSWIEGDLDRFEERTITALCRYFNCTIADLLYLDLESR